MAITGGFLCEPSPGMLAHNTVSVLFRRQQGLVDWALLIAEISAPTAQKMVEVTERYGETSKKTETAFNVQCDTDLPYFDYFGQRPAWRARFASYMKTVGSFPGTNIKHLIHGFDWASLGDATVVDVCNPIPFQPALLVTRDTSLTYRFSLCRLVDPMVTPV